jgi:hypothetical protein
MNLARRGRNHTATGRTFSKDFTDFHRFFEKVVGQGDARILSGKQENAG